MITSQLAYGVVGLYLQAPEIEPCNCTEYGFKPSNVGKAGGFPIYIVDHISIKPFMYLGRYRKHPEGAGNGGWQNVCATLLQLLIPGHMQAILRWWVEKGHMTAAGSRDR